MEWKRECPSCGKEIPYSTKGNRDRAGKRNTNCLACVMGSEEYRKNVSKSVSGEKNGMYGKFSENNLNFGSKRSEETRKNMSENNAYYWKGKKLSDEHKKNCRLSAIKRRKKQYGQCSPNYNSDGRKIINDYNKKYGFNFRHAENGGEVCIGGYFPDGVDEKRKTIIEIDEKHHFDSDGTYKEKDIQRQNYLESLGYKIIRIKI